MKRLLGFLGWLGVGLVVAAVVVRIGKPEWQPWSQGLAIAGLVATALYALSQWRDIARSFSGRNIRYGTLAVASVVFFLGLLIAINYLANRRNKIWDLTAAKQFTLSDQTKNLLSNLSKPLNVKVFYGGRVPKEPIADRLDSFRYLSKQITVEYFDVQRDPLPAERFGVKEYGTVLLEYEGRTEKLTSSEERDLTSALKKLLEGKAKKIYFTNGHSEHDIAGSDRGGYSAAVSQLKDDNFETGTATIAQDGKVPDDATVLVIAGPKMDFLAPEVDAVRTYLKKGGKLLLLLDAADKTGVQPTNLIALAKEWGIDVGNNLVVDTSGVGKMFGANEAMPIALPVPGHPIVQDFRSMAVFPFSRSATPIEGGTDGKNAQKLVQTSERSWAESDLKSLYENSKVELNADKGDRMGPISLAAAVSAPASEAPAGAAPDAPKPETRVIVFGDSDFASNAVLGVVGNAALFLNAANWLALQEGMITIGTRDPEDRRITVSQAEGDGIWWMTFVIFPLALLGIGFRTWWKRR